MPFKAANYDLTTAIDYVDTWSSLLQSINEDDTEVFVPRINESSCVSFVTKMYKVRKALQVQENNYDFAHLALRRKVHPELGWVVEAYDKSDNEDEIKVVTRKRESNE